MSDYYDPHYDADAYLRLLLDVMPHVTPNKVLEIIEAITAGYCRGCGCRVPPKCHCRNDD